MNLFMRLFVKFLVEAFYESANLIALVGIAEMPHQLNTSIQN